MFYDILYNNSFVRINRKYIINLTFVKFKIKTNVTTSKMTVKNIIPNYMLKYIFF